MSEEALPLLDLFTSLRQAGLPLGIDEYRIALRALQLGFGVADREALERLLLTVWVNSLEEARIFKYLFARWHPAAAPLPGESKRDPLGQEVQDASKGPALPQGEPPPLHEDDISVAGGQTPSDSLAPPSDSAVFTQPAPVMTSTQMTIQANDMVEARRVLLGAAAAPEFAPLGRFIDSDEYFPVTRRQMKQSWRYLRRHVREGPATELDVDATVQEFARRGMLLAPVLVPRRVNRARLALFIDIGGSMIPFAALACSLTETAQRGGRLGQASIFYFHDVPTEYVYYDTAYRASVKLETVAERLGHERVAVLFFSDAGAARGNDNLDRVRETREGLEILRRQIRYISWLNPMPRDRWRGTSALAIAALAPMFEFSRRGLSTAIDILRGRTKELPHGVG